MEEVSFSCPLPLEGWGRGGGEANLFYAPKQQLPQFLLHLLISESAGPFFSHDHQVQGRQLGFMSAKKFSQQPFDPIAADGLSQTFGDHQAQAGVSLVIGSQGDAEMACVKPAALGLRPEEITAAAEPLRLGKAGIPSDGGRRGGRRAPAGSYGGVAQGGSPPLRPKGACGPWPDGVSISGGRPGCSCGSKTRGCGYGVNYGVDRCASCRIILVCRN